MGHHSKLDLSVPNSPSSSSGGGHRHRSHHHHHHSRGHKTPREPSVRSFASSSDISSSELSTSTSASSLHHRSTPKIAAVIIAAIMVIAGLVGVTVYLVDAGGRMISVESEEDIKINGQEVEIIKERGEDLTMDFRTYHRDRGGGGGGSVMQKHRMNSEDLRNHQFRDRKDPEGPMDISIYEDFYDEQDTNQLLSQEENNNKESRGEIGRQEFLPFPPHSPPPRISLTDGIEHGDGKEEEGVAGASVGQANFNAARHRPYGERILEEEEEEELRRRRKISRMDQHNHQHHQQLKEDQNEEDLERPPLPPSGSRGGIHVRVHGGEQDGHNHNHNAAITTLDRRPGRPPFHHMGPTSPPPVEDSEVQFRRRQKLMELRRRQGVLRRRLGMLAQQSQEARWRQQQQQPVSPVEEAKRMLNKFGGLVQLAKSEVAMIRDIARNITDSGKELNLWEMMSAVNATLHDHPDSPIGRLMSRFYSRYLSEEGGYDFNSISPSSVKAHGKSLSSLLFLSFGIFLLNAVDVIAKRGAGGIHGRSFDSSHGSEAMALKSLMLGDKDESEILKEVGLENERESNPIMSADSYLRLVMNLMNARRDGGDKEMQCLWSLYCHQLNRQASLGGPLGTVAKLNSVAMRLVLQALPSEHVWGAAARAVAKWEDVKCEALFPECDKKFEQVNDNNDGGEDMEE